MGDNHSLRVGGFALTRGFSFRSYRNRATLIFCSGLYYDMILGTNADVGIVVNTVFGLS